MVDLALALPRRDALSRAQALNPSAGRLRALNFCLAAQLSGFGPFVALYLAGQGWSFTEIGMVLTAGGLAGLCSLIPGGLLLDCVRSKRRLVGLGIAANALAAILLVLAPIFPVVLTAEILRGMTAGFLGPALISLTLGLFGRDGLCRHQGGLQSYAAAGGLVAALVMGGLGTGAGFGGGMLMPLAATGFAVPALWLLRRLPEVPSPPVPAQRGRGISLSGISLSGCGLAAFAGILLLFQLANATLMPLIAASLAAGRAEGAPLLMAGLVVVPQAIVLLLAPMISLWAGRVGPRRILLLGLGVLPLRILLLALAQGRPEWLFGIQILDGVSGAAIGVLTPVITADLARPPRHFNAAQALMGTASALGGTFSTSLSGLSALWFGNAAMYSLLLALAAGAVAITALLLPDPGRAAD